MKKWILIEFLNERIKAVDLAVSERINKGEKANDLEVFDWKKQAFEEVLDFVKDYEKNKIA